MAGARVPRRLQDLPLGLGRDGRAARPRPARRARRAGRGHRSLGSRQEHASRPGRRARSALRGRRPAVGRSLARLDEAELASYRASGVAIVFQTDNLWPELSARENVATALRLAGSPRIRSERPKRRSTRSACPSATHLRPRSLSGGEQQRVAIAAAAARGRRSCSPTSRPASSTRGTKGSCSEPRGPPRPLRVDGRRRHALRPRRGRLRPGGRASDGKVANGKGAR